MFSRDWFHAASDGVCGRIILHDAVVGTCGDPRLNHFAGQGREILDTVRHVLVFLKWLRLSGFNGGDCLVAFRGAYRNEDLPTVIGMRLKKILVRIETVPCQLGQSEIAYHFAACSRTDPLVHKEIDIFGNGTNGTITEQKVCETDVGG